MSSIEAIIAIVGNINVDLLLGPLSHPPVFGHEVFVAERTLRSGGQGFYPAVALAALGTAPRLVTDIGNDLFGSQMLTELREAGVDCTAIRQLPDYPTGLSVALLDQQRDRAFVTHLGHLAALTVESLQERWAWLAEARLLLYCGQNCLPGMRPSGGVELLRQARSAGLLTAVDTGWDADDWRTNGRAEIRALLEYTDIYLPNHEEASALTGESDPARAARHLAEWGAGTVIIKCGPQGALAWQSERLIEIPAYTTTVVDTVGAGDSFNAGVLYGLARDWPLAKALRLGSYVAGRAISGQSPRYPSFEEARQALNLDC